MRNRARQVAEIEKDDHMMLRLKQKKMIGAYFGQGLGGFEEDEFKFVGDKLLPELTPNALEDYIHKNYLKKLNEKIEIGQNLGINFYRIQENAATQLSLPSIRFMRQNPSPKYLDTLDRLILEARIRRNHISGRYIWTIDDDRTFPSRPENYIGEVQAYNTKVLRRSAKFKFLQSEREKEKRERSMERKREKKREDRQDLEIEKDKIWVKKKKKKKLKNGESMMFWRKVGERYDNTSDDTFIQLKLSGTGKIQNVPSKKFYADYEELGMGAGSPVVARRVGEEETKNNEPIVRQRLQRKTEKGKEKVWDPDGKKWYVVRGPKGKAAILKYEG